MYNFGIVSMFANPLHCGHLDYMDSAKRKSHKLIVIVNNDLQAVNKIGKIYINENDRVRIIRSLRVVDDVVLSIDTDESVAKTLEEIARSIGYSKSICFFNSGDRNQSNQNKKEADICRLLDIQTEFIDLVKVDSSSRLRNWKKST